MTTDTMPADQTPTTRSARLPALRLDAIGPRLRDFFVHGVAQVRVLQKAYPGVMHALIFWGMTIQVIGTAIALMQIALFVPWVELSFPRGDGYLAYELIMDLAGIAIIAGALMAAFRRAVWRPKALETRWDDWYAIGLLLLIPALGFVTEGARIVAVDPSWANWSPAGNVLAGVFREAGMSAQTAWDAHGTLYWVHIIAALVFVASIPFTKLRHLVTGPLNIVLHPREKDSALRPIKDIEETEILGVGQVTEFLPQQLLSFDACVRCGRCEEVCPATFSGMPYSPRELVQSLRDVMVERLIDAGRAESADSETTLDETLGAMAAWYCTTCGACLQACPMFVNPVTEVIDLRRYQALVSGTMPNSVAATLRNFERQNNPWGLAASSRAEWAEDLDIRVLEPGEEVDVLLYVGCAFAYDDRNKQVGRALIRLLQAADVDFAILGKAEMCCGETARRMGHEYLFQVFAQENIELWGEYTFKRIVTPCPHCFNTLKHEYPQFGGNYQVQHVTELLAEIAPKLPAATQQALGTITFHDPCYLGRYNDVYDAPRHLLDRSKVSRVEMARRRADSFCCGGGGGQMWMETDPETRISNRRLQQALDANAAVVATACPYCLIMLDDAIRSQGKGGDIRVMDLAEILAGGLPDDSGAVT